MNWNKSLVLAASLFAASLQVVQAQDNLINALKTNQNDNSKAGFTFTEIINLKKYFDQKPRFFRYLLVIFWEFIPRV